MDTRTSRWLVGLLLGVGLSAAAACGDPAEAVDASVDAANADTEVRDGAGEDADGAEDANSDAAEPDARDDVDVAPADTWPPAGPWRSRLYPEGWTPGYAPEPGAFLQDYSWAGYRNGGVTLGQAVAERVVEVVADPSGGEDATAALQAAIDEVAAAGGGVVQLPAGRYRVDGTVLIGASGVVLRGAGPTSTQLWFTRHEGMSYKSHVTFRGATTGGEELPLAADADVFDTVVAVTDAGALAPGDDVALGWVISDAFVAEHGMSDTWVAFNGTWQPFFRRTVVAVDREATPPTVTLDVPLRYPAQLRDGASLRREPGVLHEVGVESLGVANAVDWAAAWAQNQVHAIAFDGVADGWIRDVASFPSPLAPTEGRGAGAYLQSGGILIMNSKRVTVADSVLERAEHRGGGGNGYLFEVRTSSEVLFRDCVARGGRHNFIQNWGFGATGVVWLRVRSSGGWAETSAGSSAGLTGYSEFHHSLATANLMDSVAVEDGWSAVNRRDESTGAGHTATACVFWNVRGTGVLRSYQFGAGYVVGPASSLDLQTVPTPAPEGLEEIWEALSPWQGAAPDDWLEGVGRGDDLVPSSLYEDQLARRFGR
ncbi:MAG: hypothetical protein EP329_22965 [Deltaproteobacteria bacterium]|nr:MAG: hypothetical protein EP329_22965 [Deltaproteobacteria bacterium]